MISIARYITKWQSSLFCKMKDNPWQVTANAETTIIDAIAKLDDNYSVKNDIAIHTTAMVEDGAILKGPAIIGPNCFVAATAYLRGGVFLDQNCTIGPACEIKSTFIFADSKIAHLTFVGDSLIGANVNIEAGAIIANYRNELDDKIILIQTDDRVINTGETKFGALIGDNARIGANAVVAPGALIARGRILQRLQLIDQNPKTKQN